MLRIIFVFNNETEKGVSSSGCVNSVNCLVQEVTYFPTTTRM